MAKGISFGILISMKFDDFFDHTVWLQGGPAAFLIFQKGLTGIST